jgi:hypothetical protein
LIVVNIPGIGEVEVENEKDLKILEKQLASHFKKLQAQAQKAAETPDRMIKALGEIKTSNQQLIKTVINEIKSIKPPEVNVEAPVVNIPAPPPPPKLVVEEKIQPPIKKVTVQNIHRNNIGRIETADFVVDR